MEKQPIMQTIREVVESPAVIACSTLFAAIAVKGALFPGSAPANVTPAAAVAEDKTCNAFTTYPCDTGHRFSIGNEIDVRFCQDKGQPILLLCLHTQAQKEALLLRELSDE